MNILSLSGEVITIIKEEAPLSLEEEEVATEMIEVPVEVVKIEEHLIIEVVELDI